MASLFKFCYGHHVHYPVRNTFWVIRQNRNICVNASWAELGVNPSWQLSLGHDKGSKLQAITSAKAIFSILENLVFSTQSCPCCHCHIGRFITVYRHASDLCSLYHGTSKPWNSNIKLISGVPKESSTIKMQPGQKSNSGIPQAFSVIWDECYLIC